MTDPDKTPPPSPAPDDQTASTWAHLIVIHGPNVGDVFRLNAPETIIGRSRDADIRLPHETVSRRHARLTMLGDDVLVEDLESRNGTGIGIRRIRQRQPIRDGEVLQIGSVTLLKMTYAVGLEEPLRRAAYQLGARDAVTRLPNRYFLQDLIRMECSYARRHHTSLSLVFIQPTALPAEAALVDGVMSRVAVSLHEISRAEDTLVRVGDDQFVVLLRESAANAAKMAERVRTALDSQAGLSSADPVPHVPVTAVVIGIGEAAMADPEAVFELAGIRARQPVGDEPTEIQVVAMVHPGPSEPKS